MNVPVNPSTSRLPRVRASELVGRGWLNTGGRSLGLDDLRGKVVVLDFWTFCCVNCLHVLDELRELEEAHHDELVIVGVHSPKFEHEGDPFALAAAVERYDVRHPVLDDPELVTWSAYAARAWPTLVLIDPEGYVVEHMAGEGHASALAARVAELITEHDARGTLHRGDGPYVAPAPTSGTLRFPAKAVALPSGNLLVADAGHHSLAELLPDGETLVRRIGSGGRGLADGGPDAARFSEPNGVCLVPERWRDALGYDVLVADTVNHALRGVRTTDGAVFTVAGTGEQFMVGAVDNVVGMRGPFDPGASYPATGVRLSSPWDVVWDDEEGVAVVAMAGNHSLWTFDAIGGRIGLLSGTMHEGREDGPAATAWFAQPSGLAVDSGGRIWVADSETSSVRVLDTDDGGPVAGAGVEEGKGAGLAGAPAGPRVRTAVGQGLFDFGYRDGAADQALLQHPLGVAALPDGSVAIADTYNGAIRRYTPPFVSEPQWPLGHQGSDTGGEVTTVATGLAEPSGVVVLVDGAPWDGGPTREGATVDLLVVESAAHRLTRVPVPEAADVRGGSARRTHRPATDIAAGALRLDVPFAPAPGQKLDDQFGPSTHLTVSASPPELLLDGAGAGTELTRDLVVNPDVAEGVLHVTAKAASCDIVPPGMEEEIFPACHLAQQDWGVPVRVVADGSAVLTLPLRG